MADLQLNPADLALLEDVFVNKIAFNNVLGLHIELDPGQPQQARLGFAMREELIGNPLQKILHGGVISSALDVTGGLAACLGILQRLPERSRQELASRLARLGTIDLRIDYLRPGRGDYFTATGFILRIGNKVAVTRMELHNDAEVLIAVGTGTYLVG